MRNLIVLIAICTSGLLHAQTTIKYAGNIAGGWLTGSKPHSGFVYTTQGMAYGQYRFGIGSGYDFNRVRSIPLFATVSRSFSHNHTRPFIEAAAGLNIVSPTNSEKRQFFYYGYSGSYNNGFYAKLGGGLYFRADKKWQLSLFAGYNYKTTTYNYKPLLRPSWPNATKPLQDNYHFKRWYLGVGIDW